MRHYVRKADRIDKVRGDILMLHREDVEPLFNPLYPAETRRDITDALLRWFAGGVEPRLENPIVDSYLQNLINKQKKSVQQYLDSCRINADNRALRNQQSGATGVTPGATNVGNINVNKVNGKDKRSESFTFTDATATDGGIGRPADAPPSPPVTATALTFKEANRFLWKSAPPLEEKHYTKEEIAEWDGYHFEDADFIVGDILTYIEEEGNKQTENALRKFHRELGAKVFFRAYVRFDKDWREVSDSGNEWEKPGAILIARLKKIQEAMAVFDAHMAAKSNPAPTCGSRG